MSCRFVGVAILLAIALLVSHRDPASAHPSYAVPQKTLDFGNGRTAMLEILYGDGIFFANPARAQLRTSEGATVAKTPMGGNVVTLCPSVEYCWVFLSGPIPMPWRLHPDQIAWDTPARPNPYFPEADETPPVGFAADWTPWSFVIGVVVLIAKHWLPLGAMLLPWWAMAAFLYWFRVMEHRKTGKVRWSVALSILVWLGLAAYELLAAFVVVAELGFPLLLLVVLAVAMVGLLRLSNWFVRKYTYQATTA